MQEPSRHDIVRGPSAYEKRALARELRRAQTPAEQQLWEALRAGRLAGLRFRRQQVIDGFIADFYCHSAGLVIECDGAVHQDQREYDAARDEILAQRSLRVLRFANEEVLQDLPRVLQQILEAATATTFEPPQTAPLSLQERGRG